MIDGRLTCVFLAANVLLCAQAPGSDPRARVAEWASRCALTPVVEVEWRRSVPHLESVDGPQVETMVFDVAALYRWPDCYRIDTTPVVFDGMDERMAAVHRASGWQSVVLEPSGRRTSLQMADVRELWPYGVPLADPRVVVHELRDAPILLGHWIAHSPAELEHTQVLESDARRVVLRFPSRGFTVTASGEDGASLVVERLEYWSRPGEPSFSIEYSEFRGIPGSDLRMGTVRTIRTVGTRRPVVNTDHLRSVRVGARAPDEEFTVARTVVAARIPGVIAQAANLPVRPAEDVPPPMQASLKDKTPEGPRHVGRAWLWGGVVGGMVACAVVVIVAVRRAQRYRASR